MASERKDRSELLNDSEATLRQVESALTELGQAPLTNGNGTGASFGSVIRRMEERPLGLGELVDVLVHAYGEIMAVIDGLRKSRGLLENAAMKRLKRTHQKLQEVSSATEVAASGMLDGLDRALVLVDTLEGMDGTEDGDADGVRTELREELHGLMSLLQFQDITAQQLGYAGQVLEDLESRLLKIAAVFDVRRMCDEPGVRIEADHGHEGDEEVDPDDHVVHDPEASTLNADSRQAVADEIFK